MPTANDSTQCITSALIRRGFLYLNVINVAEFRNVNNLAEYLTFRTSYSFPFTHKCEPHSVQGEGGGGGSWVAQYLRLNTESHSDKLRTESSSRCYWDPMLTVYPLWRISQMLQNLELKLFKRITEKQSPFQIIKF